MEVKQDFFTEVAFEKILKRWRFNQSLMCSDASGDDALGAVTLMRCPEPVFRVRGDGGLVVVGVERECAPHRAPRPTVRSNLGGRGLPSEDMHDGSRWSLVLGDSLKPLEPALGSGHEALLSRSKCDAPEV